MARSPDGPPPPPPVQRVRLRYARRGRLRFSSHRDFQRALERALRRIGAPMAYSAGFTPHPRISYAGAAPTGAASEAEYLEIALAERVEVADLARALDRALPDGLDIVDAVEYTSGTLADRLQASLWRIDLPGLSAAEVSRAVAVLLAAERAEVSRMTKSGLRTFDVREAIVSAEVDPPGADPDTGVAQVGPGDCAILRLVVRHTTPAVRPDDILSALRSQAALAPPSPPRMTRLAQGPLDLDRGAVADPLTADRMP